VEDQVAVYIAAHAAERDADGRRLVVRNGHARPQQVTMVAGKRALLYEPASAGSREAYSAPTHFVDFTFPEQLSAQKTRTWGAIC
jgi:hypothetical protein